ncbi:MAG TPA: hypothetical protein VI110_12355 [Lapillicoccus sp.]
MKVTVIGGTDRIGKRVTRLLVDHQHSVCSVNRRADRAAVVLAGLPVKTVACDIGVEDDQRRPAAVRPNG